MKTVEQRLTEITEELDAKNYIITSDNLREIGFIESTNTTTLEMHLFFKIGEFKILYGAKGFAINTGNKYKELHFKDILELQKFISHFK